MEDHDINDIFESKYLKASDLDNKEWAMVIASATPILVGQERSSKKVLITFQGAKKGLLANLTNCKRIAFRHGNKLSNWVGKEIILYPELVDFKGDAVEAIRVKHPVEREQFAAPKQNGGKHAVDNKGRYDTMRATEPVRNEPNPADDEIPF